MSFLRGFVMKRYILIAFALVIASFSVKAQGEALVFTRTDLSPVLQGTAGAAVAADNGPWNAFGAAASGAYMDKKISAGAGFRSLSGNLLFNAAAGIALSDRMAVYVGGLYNAGAVVADYRTNFMIASAGFGMGITDRLSVGANVRYAGQSLTHENRYGGISLDLSAGYRILDNIGVIAGISTLGGRVASATGETYPQPARVYSGADYSAELESIGTLNLDAMAEYYFSGNFAAAAGLRLCVMEYFNLRAGYRYATANCVLPTYFAVGGGASVAGFNIDVTYMKYPGDSAVGLGVSYAF